MFLALTKLLTEVIPDIQRAGGTLSAMKLRVEFGYFKSHSELVLINHNQSYWSLPNLPAVIDDVRLRHRSIKLREKSRVRRTD